jgi:GH25 family lysozyme M1 (1,4-beta-N-acetylmuramidase)
MHIGSNCKTWVRRALAVATACTSMLVMVGPAPAQRLLGLDVSAYQGEITATEWNTLKRPTNQQVGGILGDGRDFVIIRSSRGGTTGEDHRQGGYPTGNNSIFNQSERYDDPYFVQNITRATNAGLFAGAYHFARPDVIVGTVNSNGSTVTVANTGADEADHFIQMAGPWMRPGYLPPMYDFEAGQSQRTPEQMAQFSLDFSNRIYAVMGIRPSIYSNGSYNGTLAGASAPLRDQIAQPAANAPSVVSPAYPTLVIARWPNQANPSAIDVQNAHPKDSYAPIYGPWDDYGTTHPWDFWQYASTMHLNGNNNGTSSTDVDVSQGDIESVKDHLIPAVWMNDSSGNWGDPSNNTTWANWNSGIAPVQPPVMSGQLTPLATGPLPAARLPGAPGSGPTSGQNDTVILERPSANITVTLSTGVHNIRKMYMREALNITGGTLIINYDPNYASDTVTYPNALRSGPISAQFSGPVTLSGTGSLSVNTLQVDAAQTVTLAGSSGALTFEQVYLMPGTTPARMLLSGNANVNPLSNATATISNGFGSGSTGFIDLGGGVRSFNVGNGGAGIDLDVTVPITNGGLIKNGAGTLRLAGNNSLSPITLNAGSLLFNGTSTTGTVTVSGGTLGGTGSVSGAVIVNSGAHLAPGASIESLNVGALTVSIGAILDFELGAPGVSDLVDVAGQLTLSGGSLNLINTGGLGIGIYTLMRYGSFSGSLANLGTSIGPAGFTYNLFDTGNSINLVVSVPEPTTIGMLLCGILPFIARRQRSRGLCNARAQ